jgi:glycogen debranching enzyme
MDFYDTHSENALVDENSFLCMARDSSPLPHFDAARDLLPKPIWKGHDSTMDCYWRAWELAFGNLRSPSKESGFVSPFIDSAFNGCLFMWDSAFAVMFGRYGARAFDFQQTLNNFYALQHKSGYICREIQEADGVERFERYDPSSTGPNIMPWSEWEYFANSGNRDRLATVFPALLAYSQWFRKNRSWPDGTYWSTGWGCGMDNQPRFSTTGSVRWEHGHMSWIDTTCQQVFANHILIEMARVLEREADVTELETETQLLTAHLNERMWNHSEQFYVDRFRDGTLSDVKSVGAFWALLANIVPSERLDAFVAHLENENEFNRPHRVPSLSADHPQYDPNGGYWLGAVWAPTTYMVLRGLTHAGYDDLAHAIGANHLENVVSAFVSQGTLFENYAPERAEGRCKTDFVGWTGLPPIAVLFEYVFGIRPNASKNKLLWDVRLIEEHGVTDYPFGVDTLVDLHCAERQSMSEAPVIQAKASNNMELIVTWHGGQETITLSAKRSIHGTR